MKHRYHLGRKLAALTLVLLVFASSAQALELRVSSLDGLALSAEVFSESDTLEGVYVASVPSQLDAEVSLGARTLRAGDVLDRSMLSQLLVLPAENRDASCELVYCPIEGGEVQPSRALELSILTGKNEAPVCRDVKFETYKNIANTGVLSASDPEGDTLTYQLVKEPKRGTVDIAPDGSFTYTPAQNKVGKDVFTYTATDSAGNVSNVANVTVKIVKPTDKAMYQDLAGDTLAYTAMWLKDRGVYTGKRIAGNLCFEPRLEAEIARNAFSGVDASILEPHRRVGERVSGKVLIHRLVGRLDNLDGDVCYVRNIPGGVGCGVGKNILADLVLRGRVGEAAVRRDVNRAALRLFDKLIGERVALRVAGGKHAGVCDIFIRFELHVPADGRFVFPRENRKLQCTRGLHLAAFNRAVDKFAAGIAVFCRQHKKLREHGAVQHIACAQRARTEAYLCVQL